MGTMLENMFGLGQDISDGSVITEEELVSKITEGDISLEESSLSISDLKTFYNTSDSIDKDKYPSFFEWYDYMVKAGKYHPESVKQDEDGKTEKKDKILNEEDPKESLGSDIAKYQEWVDYDMKHYGKISERTQNFIDKAGLEIIKDQYGDYEVISKELHESLDFDTIIKKYYDFGSSLEKDSNPDYDEDVEKWFKVTDSISDYYDNDREEFVDVPEDKQKEVMKTYSEVFNEAYRYDTGRTAQDYVDLVSKREGPMSVVDSSVILTDKGKLNIGLVSIDDLDNKSLVTIPDYDFQWIGTRDEAEEVYDLIVNEDSFDNIEGVINSLVQMQDIREVRDFFSSLVRESLKE